MSNAGKRLLKISHSCMSETETSIFHCCIQSMVVDLLSSYKVYYLQNLYVCRCKMLDMLIIEQVTITQDSTERHISMYTTISDMIYSSKSK